MTNGHDPADASDLSADTRAWLDSVAGSDEPTPHELAVHRTRVFGALGIPLPEGSPGQPPEAPGAPSPAASASSALLGKAFIAVAVALTVVGVWSARPRAPRPVTPVASTPAEAPALPEPAVSAAPAPAPSTPAEEPSDLPPTPRSERPTVARDTLAEESMMVAAAEAQLRAGNAAAALSLYDRHLSTFAHGTLRQESQAGRIAALCRLGRLDEGRAALERFASGHPRSPSLQRLERACGSGGPAVP